VADVSKADRHQRWWPRRQAALAPSTSCTQRRHRASPGARICSPRRNWIRTIDVDLKGVFLGCKYALPELMKHGGAILSTASVAGIEGFRQMAAYCAAKAGVNPC